MKLHTVFVTYNRLELTKQAIQSYLDTVTVPHYIVIADNHSTDGTEEWLMEEWDYNASALMLMPENKYPGFAVNRAWETADPQATHLHRADNDFKFLPGWCDEVQECFSGMANLGQLGLRTGERRTLERSQRWWQLHHPPSPLGCGSALGRAAVARHQDTGLHRGSFMSPAVAQMGYEWGRVTKPCIQSLSYEDRDDPYYRKSWADRGINL